MSIFVAYAQAFGHISAMTTNQIRGFRMMAEAMTSTNNYAAQIEVDGKWQTVIDKLTKDEAEKMASRWDRSRVVQTY